MAVNDAEPGRRPRRAGMLRTPIPNPVERFLRFFRDSIWEDRSDAGRLRRALYARLRVLTLVYWNYFAHGISRHAAALTYTTLLALVPCLAVAFSVFNAFGGLQDAERALRQQIIDYLAPGLQQDVATWIDNVLEAIRRGARANALIATILLILTVVNTLAWIESSFNEIFGIKRSRPIFSRIAVYWLVATLGPVLVAASLAMTASLRSSVVVEWLAARFPLFEGLYRLAPYLLMCVAFTLLYVFLPNTKVRLRAAIVGGVLGGVLFEVAKRLFAASAIQLVGRYSQVYGVIATLFVFFFWIWISWMILLMGLEFVVATQSATTHRREELASRVSQKFREMIALRIVTEVCERFYSGREPPTAERLAAALDLPLRLIYDVLLVLEDHGVVREVEEAGGEHGFLPARHLARLTVHDVIRALREDGTEGLRARTDEESRYLAQIVDEAESATFQVFGRESMERVVSRLIEWKQSGGCASGHSASPESPAAPARPANEKRGAVEPAPAETAPARGPGASKEPRS